MRLTCHETKMRLTRHETNMFRPVPTGFMLPQSHAPFGAMHMSLHVHVIPTEAHIHNQDLEPRKRFEVGDVLVFEIFEKRDLQ